MIRLIKKIIPPSYRLKLRVLSTRAKDLLFFGHSSFVKKSATPIRFPRQLSMSQPIRENDFSENKKHNLLLAIQSIQQRPILPNQIFSFWKLIPQPIAKNGFKKGRNLLGNELALDYGGGLCQLSGIIYHLALEAGLKIQERYPHSLDIYTEASRYTPLGSDATVVYGHKDLKVSNNFNFPIAFEFEVLEHSIQAYICANQPLRKCAIEFLVSQQAHGKQVKVIRKRNEIEEICSEDFYKDLDQ